MLVTSVTLVFSKIFVVEISTICVSVVLADDTSNQVSVSVVVAVSMQLVLTVRDSTIVVLIVNGGGVGVVRKGVTVISVEEEIS